MKGAMRRQVGSGSVYRPKKKLPDGRVVELSRYWIKYHKEGRPMREAAKTSNRKEAERLLKVRLGEIAAGTFRGLRIERIKIDELLDAVLRNVARRLRDAVRSYDAIGRYGGEEFLIVSPGCDNRTAACLAERLRAAVCCQPVTISGDVVPVTLSIGVTATIGTRDTHPRGRRLRHPTRPGNTHAHCRRRPGPDYSHGAGLWRLQRHRPAQP